MSTRTCLARLLLAAAAALAGAAGAQDHGHGRGGCDGPQFECAREATPAFAPDGALWLAWSSDSRVFVARSADRGQTFDGAREITRAPQRLDHAADARPQIAIGPRGQVVVGYAVMTEVQFQGALWYAHSPDGRQFSEPRQLAAAPGGRRFLALATDPGGDVFAAWVDKRGLAAAQRDGREYDGAAVLAAWSHDGGATFGEPLIVREHTCECCRVAVDFAAAGKPVVVWRNLFGAARDHALTSFRAPGEAGSVYRVSVDDWQIDACPHHGPALAVAPDGTYHVAWFTASARRAGLFYARSTDAGASFSAPLAFGAPARQPARPQLLALGASLWLAWREFDGEATEVVVMHSADGGRSWGPRRIAGRSTGMADHPLLATDGRQAWLSWLTRAEGYQLMPLAPAEATAGTTNDL
jgi:hypothetical protein